MNTTQRGRRGNVAVTIGLSMSVILGFGALSLEFAYRGLLDRQLQTAVDHAAHAAVFALDGANGSTTISRNLAKAMALDNIVLGSGLVIQDSDVTFHCVDVDTTPYTITDMGSGDCTEAAVNAIKVHETRTANAGLFSFVAPSALTSDVHAFVMRGHSPTPPCDASETDPSEPTYCGGIFNGHIDFDTELAKKDCTGHDCGGSEDDSAFWIHSHMYDDNATLVTGKAVSVNLSNPEEAGSLSAGTNMVNSEGGSKIHLGYDDCVYKSATNKWQWISGGEHDLFKGDTQDDWNDDCTLPACANGLSQSSIPKKSSDGRMIRECNCSKTKSGKCDGNTTLVGERVINRDQRFRVDVINTELSPGMKIAIGYANGAGGDCTNPMYDGPAYGTKVRIYDDSVGNVYTLSGTDSTGTSTKKLCGVALRISTDAIANCNLHPSAPGAPMDNIPGCGDEWRTGALSIQFVKDTATTGTDYVSYGDTPPIESADNGLLYENFNYWHWECDDPGGCDRYSAPIYANDVGWTCSDWEDAYSELSCWDPVFLP